MKKLTALILCILLLTGCAQTYTGPTETVWVLRENTYETYAPTYEYPLTERTVYAYDIYGNLAQELTYRSGTPQIRYDYTYDDQGNLIRKKMYDVQGMFPKLLYRFEYTYNERGDLLTQEDYMYENHFSQLTYKLEYTYDEQGRPLCADTVSGDDRQTWHYQYDDEARTTTTVYDDSRTVCFYDENDLLLRREWICSDYMTAEEYDENGFVTRDEITDADGTRITEYTRRPDGELLTEHFTDSSGTEHTTFYEYDEHGSCIVCWRQEGDVRTELHRYLYEYDDQGRPLSRFDLSQGFREKVCTWSYNGAYETSTLWFENQKIQESVYDAQGQEIECVNYNAGADYSISSRTTRTYIEIKVPVKEEVP